MRALRLTLAIATAALLGTAAPAAADFHGACTGSSSANAVLSHSGGNFQWGGVVTCPGADSIQITSVRIDRQDGSFSTAGPQSCSGCNSVSLIQTEPAGPSGYYQVAMSFRVQKGSTVFTPSRVSRYFWNGSTLTAVDDWTDLCGASPSATVGFENDNSAPLTPRVRWSGTVSCAGADIIAINQLRLRHGGGTVRDAPTAACTSGPCNSPVTTSGVAVTSGPGSYTISMIFGVKRGGVTFNPVTVVRTWISLGAGPVVPQN